MKLNEISKPSRKAIFESLCSDTEQPFTTVTLQEIAESISKFDDSDPGMTVDEALDWLKNA
jgi:hypothetical protein